MFTDDNTAIELPRRFPPPWPVEELDACFVVTDSAELVAQISPNL
jgi:hypothetical protein